MRNYAFLLTLIAVSAEAADFRALDLGQSCSSARGWEITQGSTPIPWTAVSGAEIYAFKVRQFDQEVLASYFCVNGDLFAGNYFFPIESPDQAVNRYGDIHSRLLAVYGHPFGDSSPWNDEGDPRATSPDRRNYMTTWRTARVSATISLMPNKDSESVGWRVFLVIGKLRK